MRLTPSRRAFLAGAGLSLGSLALPASGRAKGLADSPGPDPIGRLVESLPGPVQALLPQDVFEAAGFVRVLLALEGEAKALRLPASPLSLAETALTTDIDRLYEQALPRLVALIDRAEPRDRRFADKAGGLLARLHATQHVPSSGGRRALGFDAGPEGVPDYPMPPLDVPPLDVAPPDLSAPALPTTVNPSLRFADIAGEYEAMFSLAAPRAEHGQSTAWHLAMMRQARARYAGLSRTTGVPWYFIAAIHGLEASFNFRAHLHNGDFPLTQRTRQVPAGRPAVWLPPSSWEASAADALRLLGFAGQTDWSLARSLYRLEAYNGFGYRRRGRISPYLWSFSNLYERGKYVADGRYDPAARSQQCGAAVMLKLLADAGEIAFV